VGHRYAELIPGSHVTVIEKAGHVPQEERPDAVIHAIDDWTNGLSPIADTREGN
jgi:pimeloyl-ACP methyl ester carboxylesterase